MRKPKAETVLEDVLECPTTNDKAKGDRLKQGASDESLQQSDS